MISVVICDDDEESRRELKEFCGRYFEGDTEIELSEYDSGKKFLKEQSKRRVKYGETWPEILLLDIEMKEIDGIEVKNKLAGAKTGTRIVFVTSHDELMEEGYGKYVFGFLTKPLQYEKFQIKMKQVLEDLEQAKRIVWLVQNRQKREKCFLSQILYMTARKPYTDVFYRHEDGGETQMTFDERGIMWWHQELQYSDFFLADKNLLINLAHVAKAEGDRVLMADGKEFKVSRRNRIPLKNALKLYDDTHEK